MRPLVLSMMLVACGAAEPPKPAAPAASVAGPRPIRCDGGRELVFWSSLPNGDVSTITLRCADDGVSASAETIRPPPPDTDMPGSVVARGGSTAIDHALFDRVWRAAFARVEERGCNRRRLRPKSALTLRDVHDGREATCFDLDANDIVAPLRASVKLAPPPSEGAWPFKGEDWHDEIRYYGG